MIKSIMRLLKRDRDKFRVPKRVQDILGVDRVWRDGICRVGRDLYSKCFKFTDINYAVASREDKVKMFNAYSALLNTLECGEHSKITINNRRINRRDFEQNILLPILGDELDVYREEYNAMLLDKATGANSIVQDKFLTITTHKKSIEEARKHFDQIGGEIVARFSELGSVCTEMSLSERLRVAYDFFREGEESDFCFDLRSKMRFGHDFRDYICPDSFEFHRDHFRIGDRYARAIFLKDYASYIKDSMITELCSINRSLMFSIDIIPVPTDEAKREAENRLLGVEKNITTWQQRQNANNNFSAVIPYDLEQQRKESQEFLKDISEHDMRMLFACLTMVHVADSLEQLNSDTDAILSTARKHLCQFATLRFQQMDGLRSVVPFGGQPIKTYRTLTTESLAVLMPFRAQEICQENGIYYGQNTLSKNLIIADRMQQMNANCFIMGVSGSGKSFAAKREIVLRMLAAGKLVEILIIDPEREYGPLVKALGGSVIEISATSKNHINAMDMNREYGDGENPVIFKSEFILSLCEQLVGSLDAQQRSVIDRCTANVYRHYQQGNYMGVPPTLQDFREELLKQPEPEARDVALAIELFTSGSLNTFAKHTNVDTDNRLVCYDILDLGEQLMPLGMLVVLDSIINRVTRNRAKGITTFIFIDEIYLLFKHEYSANFLFSLWKRARKYGANCTGITQNVEDLLQSHTARTMLSNSEFLVLLNQASNDRIELAKLLGISDTQMSYVTNVSAGSGLLRVGSLLVPFTDDFPKDTTLYNLMSTKPSEKI